LQTQLPDSIITPKGTCHRRVSGLKLTQNPVTCTAVRIRVVSLTTIHESPQLILQRSELHDAFLSHRVVCVSGWKYSWEAQATTIDIQRWCWRHWDRWWVRAASRVHAAEVPVRPRVVRLLPQILFQSGIKTPAFDCRELLAAELLQIAAIKAYTQRVLRSSNALGPFEHRPFGVQDAVEVKVTRVNHVLFLCVGVIVFGLFLAISRVLPGYHLACPSWTFLAKKSSCLIVFSSTSRSLNRSRLWRSWVWISSFVILASVWRWVGICVLVVA
jgi:hypothetical protein